MRCLNCFKEFEEGDYCPHCGTNNKEFKNKPNCLQPGSLLHNERYIIGKALNAGGFGIVYRAYDKTLEIIVAIKEFFPSALATRMVGKKEIILVQNNRGISYESAKENFLTEARIMEKFKTNPNVCAGYDWFEENNTAYIVMEYIDGINVRDFMQTNDNKLDLESTKWIARQVINALKDIHAKGYVFRDLTPDNIMITTDYDENGHNIVKLIDFGAAVNINTTVDTALDDVILKPGYAPIEQYVTGGVLGAYTDIYALGASIYRMLSGLVPYEATDRNKEDCLEHLVDIDDTIPEYIDRSVMKAMAIDKKIRFQTVEDFEKAFINEQEVMYPEEELAKLRRRKKVFFVLLIVICLVLASVLFYVKQKRDVGIKNISVKKDQITVMLPYQEENDKKLMSEVIADYEKVNEQITVKVEFVKEDEYYQTLSEKDKLPTVFLTDGSIATNKLCDLNKLLDSINLDNYYCFEENREQFKKAIPLGYDAAVCYVNTAMGNEDGIFKESQVNDQVAFNEDYAKTLSGKKKNYKNKDDFLNEQVAYYIGNISEWDEIAEKFPGHWSAKAYTSTLKVRYGDFVGISNEASSNQQNAGMLFIYELLTDLAQNNTYIQNGGIDLLPVNEETCEIFFKTHSDFDFIEEIEEAKVYGFIENKKEE